LICAALPVAVVVFLTPGLLFGFVFKSIIRLFLRLTGLNKTYRLMSGSDAVYCLPSFDTPETPQLTMGILFVKGRLDLDELLRRGMALNSAVGIDEKTAKMLDDMRWYPVRRFGYIWWRKDETFEVANHVRRLTR
jgi:hypothetical protein